MATRADDERDEAERMLTAMIHGERDSCPLPLQTKSGDRVLIQETRPLSKDKHWRLVEVIERGAGKVKKKRGASEDIKETPEMLPPAPVKQAPVAGPLSAS